MQIAFQRDFDNIGTASNMVAISLMISIELNMKSIVLHNYPELTNLESYYINSSIRNTELLELTDSGIDALCRFIKFNNNNNLNISNYTNTLLRERLELLSGTTMTNSSIYYKNLNDAMETLLYDLNRFYDIVFVNVSNKDESSKRKILESSDIVIASLSQNNLLNDDFFNKYTWIKDKTMFVIGRYDMNSRFNKKNIERKYKLKNKIGVIPYNIGFADACSEGKSIDFFLKNIKAQKDDLNYSFMQGVRETTGLILKNINNKEKLGRRNVG